ncbi:response regulator [Gloeocapsa sp. PCC 73106]|uniref:hybrid sensor histidine kinase/response regulator n=1 Tax=Gloeocapsa sp. PCC 73106 TaxID=102232 RepID=UPI0002ACDD8A|nr:response regulator [Gloeocapsa sp. PCC 73106]ELR97571.1 chemotaxis protein histidine kinase-like protein [Gloeocapsa sp. PCC 73106]
MNQEQQIRIDFLDEAQDSYDCIESVILGLAGNIVVTEKIDLALRSAHSLKGGAGMMGFTTLSHISHRLEDFLKILRVRYRSTAIGVEVETLLLQSVDALRQVGDLHRQGTDIEQNWLNRNIDPIFEKLHQHLGELEEEDENTLFSENLNADPIRIMFEEGVEKLLDQFEKKLANLPLTDFAEALVIISEQLTAFGKMANLEPFVRLCQSIQQQANIASPEQLNNLTDQALNLWRRSHALVIRGNLDKLPCRVNLRDGTSTFGELDGDDLLSKHYDLALELQQEVELIDINEFIVPEIESNFDLISEMAIENQDSSELDDLFSLEIPDFTAESLVICNIKEQQEEIALDKQEEQESETLLSLANFNFSDLTEISPSAKPEVNKSEQQTSKTVRVPVKQLYQINSVFSKLVLEQNKINLRLEQLISFAALMHERMNKLEISNNQLKKWYDRASVDNITPTSQQLNPGNQNLPSAHISPSSDHFVSSKNYQEQFDILEMDFYSDLHLISQNQIETIVQLQEVTTDIDLGLKEMTQTVRGLDQYTQLLQNNVTRIQMQAFADMTKSYSRLVRDLSVRFDKSVKLNIEGENTLIDRTMIEDLNASLIHLIRNAFAHGIEDRDSRITCGKSPEATITLRAINRGTQIIIIVSDDGRGIGLDKICDRLRQMGIPDEDIKEMSEAEIVEHIFQTGFTTSDELSELAGRGIGMDIVRTNLQKFQGDIQVDTQTNKGTTFTLSLPFNLSLLHVMLVERLGMVFAVPISSIKEVVTLHKREDVSIEDLKQLTWQEQVISLIRLEENFKFNRFQDSFEMFGNPVINKPTALIIGEGTAIGGIYIDRIWGKQDAVIRPIESFFPLPVGFITSMILKDGRVLPVIDPVQIFQVCLEASQTEPKEDSTLAEQHTDMSVISETLDTILVVDDSINVRRYLTLTLEKAGYRVEQAKDGQQAVDKLFAGLSVQAVICDIEMPRLNGYGFLEEVKAKLEFQSLPIVMLTSRSNEKHRKLAMNLGASAYFSKPYNEQELLQKVSNLILDYQNIILSTTPVC